MKKLVVILFVAFQAVNLQAQQAINFKIAFKPNMTYKQVTDQKMKIAISYGANMEPMVQESATVITSTITTGKADSKGVVPITMRLEADKNSEAAATLPQGATITGTIKADGTPQLDNMEAPGMPAEQKAILLGTMQAMASQNLVPARSVKLGETITIDTPLKMPLGPVTMDMNTKTTYKLTKVDGRKAYFDMSMIIDMSTNIQGQDMKGSGVGSGTLTYDMDNHYFLEQNIQSNTKMDMEAQGMKMTFNIGQDAKYTTVITANK